MSLDLILSTLKEYNFDTAKGTNSWVLANIIKDTVDELIELKKEELQESDFWRTSNAYLVVNDGFENYNVYYWRTEPTLIEDALQRTKLQDVSEFTGFPCCTRNEKFTLSTDVHDGECIISSDYFSISSFIKITHKGKVLSEAYMDYLGVLHLEDFYLLPLEPGKTKIQFTNKKIKSVVIEYFAIAPQNLSESFDDAIDTVRELVRLKFKGLRAVSRDIHDIMNILNSKGIDNRELNGVVFFDGLGLLPTIVDNIKKSAKNAGVDVQETQNIKIYTHFNYTITDKILTHEELKNYYTKVCKLSEIENLEPPTIVSYNNDFETQVTLKDLDTKELFTVTVKSLNPQGSQGS